MNIQKWVLILLITGLSLPQLFSQQIEGKIIEKGSTKPVEYANVGVLGKSRGTVSDERGHFKLDLTGLDDNDTLRISILGYNRLEYQLSKVKSLCATQCNFEMTPKTYDLKEVVIASPKNLKERIVGNNINAKNVTAGMTDSILGYEFGTLIEIKRKPARVEEVILHVAECSFDTVFLRMNVFSTKKGRPDENLLKTPVYVQFTKEEIANPIRIDLTHQNVKVEDDFLVSFEVVRELGQGRLFFSAGLFNKDKTFYRRTSQDRWRVFGALGIGIAARILQEK